MTEKNMLNQTENRPMSKKDPRPERAYDEIAEEQHDRNDPADKYKCYKYEDWRYRINTVKRRRGNIIRRRMLLMLWQPGLKNEEA